MAIQDPMAGDRCWHHARYAEEDQRAQALLYRDHHTEDLHTHDEDYAVIDELTIRVDALERPTPAKRLGLLRKRAAANLIRRKYCKEGNWLVHNVSPKHHRRRVEQHERSPDSYDHPGWEGYELRPADKLRIGPNRADIDLECDRLIDDLRPRAIDLLVARTTGKQDLGGVNIGTTLLARTNEIVRLRARAELLKALADQPEAEVRDDWFEPKHWTAGHTDDLRAYVRESQLGAPENDLDKWHAAATAAMADSSDDNDLLAICAVLGTARGLVETYPIWPAPPNDLPDVTVAGGGLRVTLGWTGTMPAGVKPVATAAVASGLRVTHEAAQDDLAGSLGSILFPSPASGRCAVLVQYQMDQARKASKRSVGTIHTVNVT